MARLDNRYSRFVATAKVVLPLIALAILATLFLFARGGGEDATIPYAEIETLAREQRLSEPFFSGVAEDGTRLTLSAQSARPDAEDPRLFQINALRLDVLSTAGTEIMVAAGDGTVDTREQVARLAGLVRLETSDGYQMETTGLTADFTSGRVQSDAELEVQAPFGTLTAGQVIFETGGEEDHAQMVFRKDVRLVYRPQPIEEAPE